jgi:hypothetical protein
MTPKRNPGNPSIGNPNCYDVFISFLLWNGFWQLYSKPRAPQRVIHSPEPEFKDVIRTRVFLFSTHRYLY